MEESTALRETPLFRGLSPAQIEKMIGISRELTFGPNQLIMAEGETGDAMYVLRHGTVEIVKSLVLSGLDEVPPEQSKTFTRLSAENGEAVFGEIALLEEAKRTATVSTVTECRVNEIRKGDFLKLAEKDFELGYRVLLNLAGIVSSRLRRADEDIIKLTTVLSIVLKD